MLALAPSVADRWFKPNASSSSPESAVQGSYDEPSFRLLHRSGKTVLKGSRLPFASTCLMLAGVLGWDAEADVRSRVGSPELVVQPTIPERVTDIVNIVLAIFSRMLCID